METDTECQLLGNVYMWYHLLTLVQEQNYRAPWEKQIC